MSSIRAKFVEGVQKRLQLANIDREVQDNRENVEPVRNADATHITINDDTMGQQNFAPNISNIAVDISHNSEYDGEMLSAHCTCEKSTADEAIPGPSQPPNSRYHLRSNSKYTEGAYIKCRYCSYMETMRLSRNLA